MSKQSSVELFAIALYEKGFLKGNGDEINDLLEEHKAMHKEEVQDAIFFGMQKGLNVNKVPETDNDWVNNYYNETFGGKKQC